MSDRPEFLGDLKSQLAAAKPRLEQRRSRRSGIAVGACVLGMGIAAIAILPGLDSGGSTDVAAGHDATTSTSTTIASPDTLVPTTSGLGNIVLGEEIWTNQIWTELPTSIGGEGSQGVFWTGSVVIAMRTENGGADVTGEIWDPVSNTVGEIADSGLIWRTSPAMVWTGSEVLMVGGSNGPGIGQIGAAYNPQTDTWRELADPPGDLDAGPDSIIGPAAWTGSEMLVPSAGLAYSPANDSWHEIQASPLSQRAYSATVWTGSQIIVWGGCYSEDEQCDEVNSGLLSDGVIYSPDSDTWEQLPDAPISGAAHMVAGWSGSEMMIVVTEGVGGNVESAAFDPESMTWRTLAASPLSPRRHAAGIWIDGQFVVWGGGQGDAYEPLADGAVYDPTTDSWTMLGDSLGAARLLHTMVVTDAGVYISAGRTGQPLLLDYARAQPVVGSSDGTKAWAELPTLIGGEAVQAVFWTGSAVISMATNSNGDEVTGEVWTPASNSMSLIAESDLLGRYRPAAVWTGTEVLVVGGINEAGIDRIGAAYNLETNSWRPIAEPPGGVVEWNYRPGGPAVWTGNEMVFWSEGLAYDPATDSWNEIQVSPLSERLGAATVWTGSQIVVWGGCYTPGGRCEDLNDGLLDDGAIYSPSTDTWEMLPASPLSASVRIVAGWSGAEVILVGTDQSRRESAAATFDPDSMTWTTIANPHLSARHGAAGVWAGGKFFLWGGVDDAELLADGVIYDPLTDGWTSFLGIGATGRAGHSMVVTDVGVYASAARSGAPLLLQLDN